MGPVGAGEPAIARSCKVTSSLARLSPGSERLSDDRLGAELAIAEAQLPVEVYPDVRRTKRGSCVDHWRADLKPLLSGLEQASAAPNAMKPWALMAMGLLGAGISLDRARPLIVSRRTVQALLAESVAISGDSPSTVEAHELKFKEWFVGFHLNSAQLRLAAVYEQILKTILHVKRGDVPELEKRVAAQVGGAPPLETAFRDARAAVRPIRKRVNAWKHTADPYVDTDEPLVRWRDANKGLLHLVVLIHSAAEERGVA